MAGLLNQGPVSSGPTSERMPRSTEQLGGEAMDSRVPDDETPNVSDEEQAAYEDFVNDGLVLIYEGGKVRQSILDMLDEDPADLMEVLGNVEEMKAFTPPIALAATTVIVVLETIRRAGTKPDDAIIMHGGKELLEDLANLAEEAGIHDFSQEELNKAWFVALDLYREAGAAEGLVDLDQLKAEFAEIQAADREGRLGELFASGGGR